MAYKDPVKQSKPGMIPQVKSICVIFCHVGNIRRCNMRSRTAADIDRSVIHLPEN